MYAAVLLAILFTVTAAVQFLPGVTDDSKAADYVINLSNPSSVTGADWNGSNTLTFNSVANDYTYTLTGVRSSTINIIFQTGVATTVTMNNVTMTGRITLNGNSDITLLLDGTNSITGNIAVVSTATATASIVIDSAITPGSSDGSLRMIPNGSSSNFIAGIGGQGDSSATSAPNRNAGKITINGGTVTATGGYYGAGIGGGCDGKGGEIIINSGTVTATGGSNAAGIGGGASGACGTVTINGGTVTAKGGSNSTNGAAGIGGGDYGAGGIITINGGTISATGSEDAAGIGGGYKATGGIVTINGGTVTATGGKYGAGIGGGNYKGGDTTIINDGTVTAIGGYYGAGIGGGREGAGGEIIVNGGTVTATGGSNAAGIGGGNNGKGATLTIGSDAEIKAYSSGPISAINAEKVTSESTGYYANAYFSSPISKVQATTMVIFEKGGSSASIGTLSLPADYKCFAIQINGSIYPENLNIYIAETGGLRQVLRNDNSSSDIPTGRSTGTTSLLVKTGNIVSSAMHEVYLNRNNLSDPLQSDTFTYMGSPGGIYSKTFPYFSDYVPIGYKLDSAPVDPTDYIPGDPVGIAVPGNTVRFIYVVYTELVWRDIDLADADKSLTNLGWKDYYFYSEGTLTILNDPPEIGERYKIHQTGPHSVTDIVMNAQVTLPIALSDIDITGRITLNSNANVTLMLDGDTVITGNIIVQPTATITIDSVSGQGNSDGSLTVIPNGTSSNGLAGIGGANSTVIINGGTVTATGGAGAAGIGGNGANVFTGSGADVKAYSDGAVPAIYASLTAGTGYYVNAILTEDVSETLLVYASDDASDLLTTLKLPSGYRGFAFQFRGSVSPDNYNIFSGTTENGVLRIYDNSALIYSVNSLNGYDSHAGAQGALPVKLGALTEITLEAIVLEGTLPDGVTFTYTDSGTPQIYTAPFYVSETCSLLITVHVPAGYEFLRWQDSLDNIVGASATAQTADVTAYSAARSAVLTSVFAVSGDRITVTLDSDPVGALLEYAIGNLKPQTYTGPFWMERSETLTVKAETVHTFIGETFSRSFLRWENDNGMFWDTATMSNLPMPSAPVVAIVYTAVYPNPDDMVVIDLAHTGGASAALTYSVNSVQFTYTGTSFTILRTDSLTIAASSYGMLQFMRWYDSEGHIVSNTVATGTLNLTGYGSNIIFTAYFVDPASAATLTLNSYPVLSGAFQYRLSGTLSWIGYGGSVALNIGDSVEIRATASSGYGFRFWEDPAEANADRTYTVSANATLTAFFLAIAASNKVTITLTSNPASTGTFSWQLPGMIAPIVCTTSSFDVNKADYLTVIASAESGYTFRMWEDSSTLSTRYVGTHADDTEYIAFFLSENPSDWITLTLNTYPSATGTFQYKLSITSSWMGYSGPVTLNRDDEVYIRTVETSGYSFRFWEDPAETNKERAYVVSENTTLTAFFLSNDPAQKIIITLTSTPASAGTFSWQLPGMIAPIVCTTSSFEVNKTDNLTIMASQSIGYIFQMWDDSSVLPTRHVGTHTDDAKYIAFFLSENPADQVTLTLNSYSASMGAFQYKFDNGASWMGYSGPVTLNKDDEVYVRTVETSGYSFRFWEDPMETNKERTYIVSADTTLTAFFLSIAASDRVTITPNSDPVNAGTFSWQLPGMIAPIVCTTSSFEVNKTDYLTLIAVAGSGYIFQMWDDSSTDIMRSVGTHIHDTAYIAFFLSENPEDQVILTLNSYPASSGTFQYKLDISASWTDYYGPVVLNKDDEVLIQSTAALGYGFRFWEDPMETNAGRTYIVSANTALTAFFLATAASDKVTITLSSNPASTGTFSWQLPGMIAPTVCTTSSFEVNKADYLTVIASAESGYAFRMWEDSSLLTARHVGTHTEDTEYIAFFLSQNHLDLVTLTLNTYPASAGTFQYKLDIGASWLGYSGPVTLNRDDEVYVRTVETSGYSFRFWEDPAETNKERVYVVNADTAFTAFFLAAAASDKATITIMSNPVSAGTFSWQLPGMDAPVECATSSFEVNKTDYLIIRASQNIGYTFKMWDDSSTDMIRPVGTHTVSAVYTAFFLGADTVALTLSSYPASSGAFQYKLDTTAPWMGYSGPMTMNRYDEVYIRATATSDYIFRFWGDDPVEADSRIAAMDANTTLIAFFLATAASEKVTITLTSNPASTGIFSWQLPGMDAPMKDAMFEVNKTDDLMIIAVAAAGYTFRMWDDSSTVMTRHVGTHTVNTEYTAFFLSDNPLERVTITLISSPGAGGTFAWSLPQMTAKILYAAPFELNKTDDLTIIAAAAAGYTFQIWGDDPSASMTRNVGTHAEDTAYTAFFLSDDPADWVTLTLNSYPASTGTFQYKFNGTVSWFDYIGPVTLNNGGIVAIQTTAASDYSFRFWGDDSAETNQRSIAVNTDIKLTAFFLSDDPAGKVEITLTPSPAGAGTFFWQLPGMDAPVESTRFEVNNTDDLTIITAAAAGYTFQMWGDDPYASMTRNVGTNVEDTEYTAYFLTTKMSDRVLVILNTNIAAGATLGWQLQGMIASITYTEPFYINNTDDLTVCAYPATGYTFQFWEDTSTDEFRHVGIAGEVSFKTNGIVAVVECTAYCLSDILGERTEITLTPDPMDGGTFLWGLSGMTMQMLYDGPFEINKTDVLIVTAVAESGYIFLKWEDLSDTATRNIGTHTADSAGYIASFKLLPKYYITATAGPNGSIDPTGPIHVVPWTTHTFTFTPNQGFKVGAVYVDGEKISGTYGSYTFQSVISDHEIHVEFNSVPAERPYYITAISDDMTTILPEGVVVVAGGANKTFYFSAVDGNYVSAITVDGEYLSQAEIDAGYYTFYDVHSDHIIRVTGDREQTTTALEIEIKSGGYAEYSVNGGPFQKYVSPVSVYDCTEITLRAYADDGYRFVKWETPKIYTTPEITVDGVAGTMYVKLYFE